MSAVEDIDTGMIEPADIAAAMARLAVFAELDFELAVLGDELAFHVAAKVKIAAMGDAFQFAEFAGG